MRRAALAAIVLGLSGAAAAASPWEVPAPGSCESHPPLLLNPPKGEDAAALTFPKPGETLTNEHAERLRYLLPPELWEKRDRFLFDGMQMEIGPCYRDYAPPAFFAETTGKLHGAVTLNGDGKLAGYKAGLPFPPETIAATIRGREVGGTGRAPVQRAPAQCRTTRASPSSGARPVLQIRGRADRAADTSRVPGEAT